MADQAYDNPVDTLQIYADTAEEETGTPADLIMSVIHSESSFDPDKVSKRGAVGLMQLTPVVAKKYGVTDPLDPVQNIRAGAKYIADLLKRYDGNQELALAAYHAGPEHVKEAGRRVPSSSTTQNYVRKTMQNYSDPGNLRRLYRAGTNSEKLPEDKIRELVR
jgi:soluble lytic murein transglycosylase-like protein